MATKPNAQLVVFRLDERSYAVHLSQVARVVRAVDCTPLPGAPDIVVGVIDLEGTLLPVLNIRKRFGLPDRDITVDDQFIIARASGRTVALIADAVVGVIDHPLDQVVAADKIFPRLDQIEGVVQLEDGLVLIRDLTRFLAQSEEQALELALVSQSTHGT